MAYDISGPVPVVFGRARIPLRLIESPFNHQVIKHSDKLPKGNVYSLALAGCWGPVSKLFNLYINGKPLGIAADKAGDYHDDDHGSWDGSNYNTDHSKVRIYWGTDTQSPDDFLNGSVRHGFQPPRNPDGSFRTHPAYSGLFYVIFHNLHLDDGASSIAGTANIPPIEAEVFVPASFGDNLHYHGVNWIAAAHAWLTNSVWGAALPISLVPPSKWQDAAAQLSASLGANAWRGMCSPQLTSTGEMAAVLAKLFGFYDGYAQVRNGSVEPGWVERQPSAWGGATEISRHDLLTEPDIDPGGWEDTLTEVSVKARNVSERLSETSLTERSTYVRDVRGTDARETIDGDWLINPAQQRMHALRVLSDRSQPPFRARLKLPRSFRHTDGRLILPGDLVHLDYAPYELDLVCQVIEREDRKGEVLLIVGRASGAFPEEYVPVEDTRLLPYTDPPEALTTLTLLQLPYGYSPADPYGVAVAVLASRPHSGIAGAHLWASSLGAFAGEEAAIEDLDAWVDRVTIDTADASTISFTHVDPLDVALYRSFGAAEQIEGGVLILVQGELISLGQRDASYGAPPLHKYNCTREMWGSRPAASINGAEGLVFPRATLDASIRRHSSMLQASLWHIATRTYTALEVDDSTANFVVDLSPPAPQESWGFIKSYNEEEATPGLAVLPPGEWELGSNRDGEDPAIIDTVERSIDSNFGLTQGAGETWPRHALRRVLPNGVSAWAVFPFKSWRFPYGMYKHYEGKQRVLSGHPLGGGLVWQNIDGGLFVRPIGPSSVNVFSLYAERIRGQGGYEIGVENWQAGGVSSIGSGNTDGFASLALVGFTAVDHLYVKIPKSTTWRFSFLFEHVPD